MAEVKRTFDGTIGQRSKGRGGADQIEHDLDNLFAMLDPSSTIKDFDTGQTYPGGIKPEYLASDFRLNDTFVGERTINPDITEPYAETGTLTKLLSWFAKRFSEILGTGSWKSTPPVTLTEAYQHITADAPHTGHETLEGAQAKVDLHNATTNNVHGVAGNVVGTTDTQTLSNKSLGSDLNAANNKIINLAAPTSNTDAATKIYVDNTLGTHKSSNDHDSRYYTKNQLATAGQAIISWGNLVDVPNLADPNFAGWLPHRNNLPLDKPVNTVYGVTDDGDGKPALYVCVATSGGLDAQWKKIGDVDWTNNHSGLTGLLNDDHPQYLNLERGDNLYYRKHEVNNLLTGKADVNHTHTDYVTRVNGSLAGDLDFAGHIAKNMVEDKGIAFPPDPVVGQRFYRTDLNESFVYKGITSGWVAVSGRGAVLKRETFTANTSGVVTFVLTTGRYEVGTSSLLAFKNGMLASHTEISSISFQLNVTLGDTIVAWYLENTPEVINMAVQKDGSLQTNLNADMLDGKHASDFLPSTHLAEHLRIEIGVSPPENPNSKTFWYEDLGESIDFVLGGGLLIGNASTDGSDDVWFDENV